MNELKAMILGAGFAGQGHALALRDCGVEIVAKASRTRTVVERVAGKLDIPVASTDWERTLREIRPDFGPDWPCGQRSWGRHECNVSALGPKRRPGGRLRGLLRRSRHAPPRRRLCAGERASRALQRRLAAGGNLPDDQKGAARNSRRHAKELDPIGPGIRPGYSGWRRRRVPEVPRRLAVPTSH